MSSSMIGVRTIPPPKGPPWWRPFARRRWRRALELPTDLPRRLASHVGPDAAALGLRRAGDCSTAELALTDGRLVPRQTFWRNVEPEQGAILAAATRMLEEIARKHGAGRVWGLPGLEIVHPLYEDGAMIMLDDANRPAARLRAAYHHEADAYTPAPPEVA